MNIPVCPTNNLIVEIDQKYKEQIQTESGIQLYVDTTYRPEWHTTVTGRVVSLPRRVDGRGWERRARIPQVVQVGDEIAFSYLVIFDLVHSDDRDEVYYEEPMGDPCLTQYSNRLGHKLIVRFRYSDGLFDVAAADEQGVVYELHKKLTLVQRDNWLGKFTFAESNKITYNNLVEVEGRDYWKVDYGHVIAINRGGIVIPVGGHVLLEPPRRSAELQQGGIILLNRVESEEEARPNEAKVLAIGEPLLGRPRLECAAGDTVVFDERFAEQYELWGREVLVLRQERLLARVEPIHKD